MALIDGFNVTVGLTSSDSWTVISVTVGLSFPISKVSVELSLDLSVELSFGVTVGLSFRGLLERALAVCFNAF